MALSTPRTSVKHQTVTLSVKRDHSNTYDINLIVALLMGLQAIWLQQLSPQFTTVVLSISRNLLRQQRRRIFEKNFNHLCEML